MTGPLDLQTGIQLLLGSVGGLAGAWLMAYIFRKDKDQLQKENKRLLEAIVESLNARIQALEDGQKACEQRYNMLLQYILNTKKE